jgi:hypothetical protein
VTSQGNLNHYEKKRNLDKFYDPTMGRDREDGFAMIQSVAQNLEMNKPKPMDKATHIFIWKSDIPSLARRF